MPPRRWSRLTLAAVAALAMLSASSTVVAGPSRAEAMPAEAVPVDQTTTGDDGSPVERSAAAEASAELAAAHGVALESGVLAELDQAGAADFWVVFEERADLDPAYEIEDWADRGRFVHDRLVATAEASQAEFTAGLTALGVDHESFWLANTVLVRGGDQTVLDGVLGYPEVAEVRVDEDIPLPEPVESADEATIQAVEWGIANIQADRVWSELGVRGEGIVVGSIDTGVEYTHPALVNQYRGNLGAGEFDHDYHWWDPAAVCPSPEPCDNNRHGTHTTGTMVGDDGAGNQVGVAPRAQWIAAKGCESGQCSREALLSSAEFMLAPTDLDGTNRRPELRPHLVNNSWGGGGGDPWYDEMVVSWTAAGMFPVFSNGNSGPGCDTAGSPGDGSAAYSVGAYDRNNAIASFSSRGPGRDGIVKPNVSGPGVSVRSSVPGEEYQSISGTSMAAPHVAGTVALMLAAAGRVGNVAAVRAALDATAIDTEDLSCGGAPENNNVYGQGRLDALAATTTTALDSGVAGQVVDADTGDPVGQVRVEVVEAGRSVTTAADGGYRVVLPPGTYTLEFSQLGQVVATVPEVPVVEGEFATADTVLGGIRGRVLLAGTEDPLADVDVAIPDLGAATRTGPDGEFRFRLPAGSYSLELSRFGYLTELLPDVVVADREVTVADGTLARAPSGTVTGTVTDEVSGHGLPGVSVEVLDVPVDLAATTDADGSFAIDVIPAGTYRVQATTSQPGTWWPIEPVEITVTGDATTEVDFPLPPSRGVDRVSVSSDGGEADARTGSGSANGAISDDGRYVAFYGDATNLADVPGAGLSLDQRVYIHDRHTGTTELVPDSPWRPSISGDGRYVAVPGPAGLADEMLPPELPPQPRFGSFDDRIHVRDRVSGEIETVSVNSRGEAVGSHLSIRPVITPDGRYVAFVSDDPQVGPGGLPACEVFAELWRRLCPQVVVHDRVTGETELVSVNDQGEAANAIQFDSLAITPDGRHVAFSSSATNLVPEQTNPTRDIYVRDRQTGRTEWVSVLPSTGGFLDAPVSPDISDDGQFVTYARGFHPAALYDRATGETVPLTGPGDPSDAITLGPVISGDGRFVTYYSQGFESGTVVPESTGPFLLDRRNGEIERLAEGYDGSPVAMNPVAISRDGRFVQVTSEDERLVPGVTNGVGDVYVIDRGFDPTAPAPRFVTWDASVTPAAPAPGEPVEVTARVKNAGDLAGDYQAGLLVDGVPDAPGTTVSLAPGEVTEVTLTVAREEGGRHPVRIGQAAGAFRVQHGTLRGDVRDANDGILLEATVTATAGDSTRTTTTRSGAYQLDELQLGTWTVTIEADSYRTETMEVVVSEDGQQLTRDLSLRTGVATPGPEAIETVVAAGVPGTAAGAVTVTNSGTADLSWNAFAWEATAEPEPSILVYSSATNTDATFDAALRRLGLDYTVFREEQPCSIFANPRPGAAMAEFGEALTGGDWDLVLVDHACSVVEMPASTSAALTAQVAEGRRLVLFSWQLLAERDEDRPLWEAMGVEFREAHRGDLDGFPGYWWAPEHPLFAGPLPVPEFVGAGSLLVEPAAGFTALAGYFPEPRPDHALMVAGNDGRTLFRAFWDGPNHADLDGNGVPDGVQLWVNSIVQVGGLAVSPWLDAGGSGTLTPDGSVEVAVSIDATSLAPGGYPGTVSLASDAGREPLVTVPVTATVLGCDRTITGNHRGRLTVTDGVTCLAEGARVTGSVQVGRGAGLVSTGATVTGLVSATGAVIVELHATDVRGRVTIRGTTGRVTLAGGQIRGPVQLVENATGQTPIVVSGNRIVGSLACTGNQPPPVDGGTPNAVTGPTTGQCAGW